jgi:phage host-nuclease inhibitor protein Gam
MYIQKVTIDNDNEAEDWIEKIKESEAECDRLVSVCKAQIEKYQNKIAEYEQQHADNIKDVMTMLGEYCRLQASRTTKTLTTHKQLPSGTLKWVKKSPSVVRDDSKLLEWAKYNAPTFVKKETKIFTDWAELKKTLKEADGHYEFVTVDGELINVDGVTLVAREDEFVIE